MLKNFAKLKKGRTFVPGKMAEWSIAPVLKTDELRGSGGSNPSLSAQRNLQEIESQSCRFFFVPKKMHQKCTEPRFYALLRAFFKSHISHISYHIFSFCQQAQNTWYNFSAIFVKKMHEKRNHFRSSLLKMSLHQHSPFLIPDSKIWSHCPKILVSSI